MKDLRTIYLYCAISLCPIMKPLHLFSITLYIQTYAALYILDIRAIMYYYFLSQRYELNFLFFTDVNNDGNHTSLDAIHAMDHNP